MKSWPDLRRATLFTSGEHTKTFYQDVLEMKVFVPGENGLDLMHKHGAGSAFKDE